MLYEAGPSGLNCSDDCGSLLVTNLVDLHFELHVLMAIGKGVDAIGENVPLIVEGTQSPFQIL